jgi:hypothetical protein
MPLAPSTSHDERPEETADSATVIRPIARPPTKKSDWERVRARARSPTATGSSNVATKTVIAAGWARVP